ncbi:MAG: T9SS type A sorting domain-containing protein [Ignavibacteriales bacterium]|nr:T9SS type A sorting domain-containing protein [Ignavibacteriales bacterium]
MKQQNQRNWVVVKIMIVLLFVAQSAVAENKLSFVKGEKNQMMLCLSNTDPIAGMQFSIHARGIALETFEGTDRAASSALGVYQYLKDATTLNVVILAPVRCSLPVGNGLIGRIHYEMNPGSSADTCDIFLTGLVICNQDAKALDVTASRLTWSTQEGWGNTQSALSLEQNYPNPFNPSTMLAYRLERASHVVLSVYDITGRQVETLVDRYQSAGMYQVRWNAEGAMGRRLASGVYIARLQVDGRVSAKTMNYTK